MDVRTLRSLEWDRVLALLSLCAQTEEGKARAGTRLPGGDANEVMDRHARVEACMRGESLSGALSLEGYRRPPSRVPKGLAFPLEVLRTQRDALRVASRAEAWILDPASPKEVIRRSFPAGEGWRPLLGLLERTLDERGDVADGASQRMRSIRREREAARGQVLSRMESLVDRLGSSVLREATYTVRNGRLVLPVQTSFKGQVKGILHDTSSTGATAYIEPFEVVDLNNRLTALDAEEREEIHRILVEVSGLLSAAADTLEAVYEAVERLDEDLACARLGRRYSGILPQVTEEGDLVLVSARHPLLAPELNDLRAEAWGESPRGPAVPLDLSLHLSGTRSLVVSGPNAGGKSVALKTVGLLCLMHQSGIPIPASEGTRLPVLPCIHATVGDTQSILDDLSTFSARMVALRDALVGISEPFLFILDELGSGTDPAEGSALGEAILLHLHEKRGFTLASTHFESLKMRALVTDGMGNAGMEFAEGDRAPTFRLRMGQVGASRALEIAERSGVPAGILARARTLLPEGEKHLRDVMAALEAEAEALAAARKDLEARRSEAEAAAAAKERAARALDAERRRFVESLPALLKEAETRFVEALKPEVNKQAVRRVAPKAAVKVAEEAGKSLGLDTSPSPPRILPAPGDLVRVLGLGFTGRVMEADPSSGRVLIEVEGKTLQVGASDVEVLENPPEGKRRGRGLGTEYGGADARWEIHLLGRTAAEAEAELEPFLDRAVAAGLSEVRIIHGIGTGRLRAAVREWLKRCPYAASWEEPPPSGGGAGVTLVRLRT
ncbi:MAG: endonuclease MutS2 [Acidobacteriota bacterium]